MTIVILPSATAKTAHVRAVLDCRQDPARLRERLT
jgi:hypothetical protein